MATRKHETRATHVVAGVMAVVAVGCAAGPGAPPPRSVDAISADYRSQLEYLKDKAAREIVWIDCKSEYRHPSSECGLIVDTYVTKLGLVAFQREHCTDEASEQLSDACRDAFIAFFRKKLADRYFRADDANTTLVCSKQRLLCDSNLRQLELATLLAHTDQTFAKLDADTIRVVGQMREALEARQVAVDAQEHEREHDDARRRAVLGAIGASLQAFGSGLSGSAPPSAASASVPSRSYTPASSPASAPAPSVVVSGCASDFECGIGKACIKGELQMRGTCATTVNRYGTPVYEAPRANLGVGREGQCRFDTDCSIGSRCEKGGGTSGTCLRPR